MSEDRETPAGAPAAHEDSTSETAPSPEAGSPVEESEATTTEVRAAVDRAGELSGTPAAPDPGPESVVAPSQEPAAADAASGPESAPTVEHEERPAIVDPDDFPSAGPSEPVTPAAAPAPPGATTNTEGNIVISPDHPMAALYMQTPMQPELKGNRGAGILISLLATIVFAAIYAGVIALWLAPSTPPSRFVGALLETALWPAIAASVMFFVALAILVLIVGRAGWWAYVLGGFLVAVLVWAGAIAGATYGGILLLGIPGLSQAVADSTGAAGGLTALGLIQHFGLSLPVIAAGIVAREVTVWFGAWIGARGRRVTRKNTEALAEYERALAEAQAKQP